MTDARPGKIHLIPDEWHIHHVGKLSSGDLFLVDSQLDSSASRATKDYVCTYIFDQKGTLKSHHIELIGERGVYSEEAANEVWDRHLQALGEFETTDIWICPFEVDHEGIQFGAVPSLVDDGDPHDEEDWHVEFMPGNTLSFYAPWEEGEYDT